MANPKRKKRTKEELEALTARAAKNAVKRHAEAEKAEKTAVAKKAAPDRRKSAAVRFEGERKEKAAAAAEAKKTRAKSAVRSLGKNPTTSVRDTFRGQAAKPQFGREQTAAQRMQGRSENWARLETQKAGADKSTRKKIEAEQDRLHKANRKDAKGMTFDSATGQWKKGEKPAYTPNVLPGMSRDAQRAGTERSLRSGVVAPDMQKAAKKHQDAAWDRVRGPETGERIKKMLSGAAKGYGSDMENFHGLAITGRGLGMEKEHAREIKVWEDEIRQWEKSLRDWEADGSLTNDERKELTDLIAANRKKIEMYEKQNRGTRAASQEVYQTADALGESGARDTQTAKRGLGAFGSAAIDVGTAGAQMLGDMALGGTPAILMRGIGGGAKEARQSGASHMQQANYGMLSGAASVLTEKISNVAKPLGKAFGKGAADDLIQKGIDKAVKKLAGSAAGEKALQTIAKHGANALGEGFEESLEAALDPLLKRATYDSGAQWDLGEIIYNGIIGAGTGLVAGSGMEAAQNGIESAARGVRDRMEQPLPLPRAKPKGQETGAPRQDVNSPEMDAMQSAWQETDSMLGSDSMRRYMTQVDLTFQGNMREGMHLRLGDTPQILRKFGAKSDNVVMTQDTARKIAYPSGYLGVKHGHNLGIPALKQLPMQVANPEAVLRSKSQPNSLVLLTKWIDKDGAPVIIALHLDKRGQLTIDNQVASAYGKRNLDALVGENGENILWTKKEDTLYPQSTGLQLPETSGDGVPSTHSISQADTKNKSIDQLPSNGRPMPEAMADDTLVAHSIAQNSGGNKAGLTMEYGKPKAENSQAIGQSEKPGLTIAYGKPQAGTYDSFLQPMVQLKNKLESDLKNARSTLPSEMSEKRIRELESRLDEVRAEVRQMETNRAQFTAAQETAAALGAKFEIADLGAAAGKYENGTITINSYTGNPVRQVFVHEMTHYIESSGQYDALKGHVLQYIAQDMHTDVKAMQDEIIRDYAQYGVKLDENGAQRELVAKFCEEKLFTDEKSIQRLAQTDVGLFGRIRQWISDTIRKLRGTKQENALREMERLYEKAARTVGQVQTDGGAQYLFSREWDENARMEAEQMERSGMSREEIWQNLGLIRDTKGNWVHEIDDSGMQYDELGLHWMREDERFRRLEELEEKAVATADKFGFSDSEYAEWNALSEEFGDAVWEDHILLRDFIRHDALFQKYPMLRFTELHFEPMGTGERGYFDRRTNTIHINEQLKRIPEDTLLHEIQHMLQRQESRPGGATPEYWRMMTESGESRTPMELYKNTAGEIEAREAASRRTMTADERRKAVPDLGWDRAVFAEDTGQTAYSIETLPDGEQVVVVDTDQERFAGKPVSSYSAIARKILLDKFKGQVLPLGRNDLARFQGKQAGEYAYPRTQYPVDSAEYEAKMRASTELDNLLSAAEYSHWAKDQKNHPEATLGFDYYKVKFAAGGHLFEGLVNIANSEKGRIFYDITKIKEIPDTSGKYATPLAQSTSTFGNLINNSIPQTGQDGNTQNSLGLSFGQLRDNVNGALGRRSADSSLADSDEMRVLLDAWEAKRQAERQAEESKNGLTLTRRDMEMARSAARLGVDSQRWEQADNPEQAYIYGSALRAVREADQPIREFMAQRQAELQGDAQQAAEWIASFAKDKKTGLQYQRETMERNIRDIFGGEHQEQADAIIREYITPVHQAVAEGNRLKNDYRARVKALKLNGHESALVQMLLENETGAVNEYLANNKIRVTPEMETKLQKAVEEFRAIYNELYTQINAALIRNGQQPAPFRKNYAPHFRKDKPDTMLGKIRFALGLGKDSSLDLPTDLAGITDEFRPGKKWFGNLLRREGEITDFDAVAGFDGYIETAADLITLTDSIQKLRALEDATRYTLSDEGVKEQIDAIRANDELDALAQRKQMGKRPGGAFGGYLGVAI